MLILEEKSSRSTSATWMFPELGVHSFPLHIPRVVCSYSHIRYSCRCLHDIPTLHAFWLLRLFEQELMGLRTSSKPPSTLQLVSIPIDGIWRQNGSILHQYLFLSHYIQFLWAKAQIGELHLNVSGKPQSFVCVDSLMIMWINSLILLVIAKHVFQSPHSLLTPN